MGGRPEFREGDALVIVDVQRDFLPGGALAVREGDDVVPVLNSYIARARERRVPVFATRDWHPENHCSFQPNGGSWPVDCVASSEGAQFAPGLDLAVDAHIVSKATEPAADAYSGFQGTDFAATLRERGIRRLWIGGLATDYCVVSTVLDARKAGFDVLFLEDASRAVDRKPGDGARAIARMREAGAVPVRVGAYA